ncbi:MAG: FAD-dependent 5-carboxymethylaminomethyl-2-thiouridine(34) oxidoreductase MnmC [Pseudomonadota bacterium]
MTDDSKKTGTGRLMPLAALSWHSPANQSDAAGDAPFADDFDDIYFSGDGPAEVRHVFLDGNDLTQRFAAATHFSIGELGFGSALNFLSSWALWDKFNHDPGARLHFFSIEKYPLSADDFSRAIKAWPTLAPYGEQIAAVWPHAIAGFHRLTFPRVSLTLFLGDVTAGLNAVAAQDHTAFDCWFLDGFSPAKNPAMWTPEIFGALAALSTRTTTLSTFTAAGQIRRDLDVAGFTASRSPGFGRKRHMVRARYRGETPGNNLPQTNRDHTRHTPPWANTQTVAPLPIGARVAIIGGGIAGASLCQALRAVGLAPTLFEGKEIAAGASGNRAALVMPRLDKAVSPTADFFVHAWLFTQTLIHHYRENDDCLFVACGVTRSDEDDEERARLTELAHAGLLPTALARAVDDGVHFPTAGLVDPRRLINHLIGETPTTLQPVRRLIDDKAGSVLVETDDHMRQGFDAVVLANGLECLRFIEARGLPLTGSVGQLDVYDTPYGQDPAQAFGPYAGPTPLGGETIIGATYDPYEDGQAVVESAANRTRNLEALAIMDPGRARQLADFPVTSRAAVRCVTPDRLPVAGPLPDWAALGADYEGYRFGNPEKTTVGVPAARYQPNRFILTGLGSRGIVTAPYCAAILAAQMAGQIMPAHQALKTLIHPGRFFIRALKRAQRRAP